MFSQKVQFVVHCTTQIGLDDLTECEARRKI